MTTERAAAILVLAALLLWPALLNGYPIVFADTGTYLSQAVHRYLGWDRPPFYSLFMLPLHLTLTTWPVVVAQALLTAWVLSILWRVLAPRRRERWLVVIGAGASVGTWLPWLTSELMPDIFTPLLVLVFGLLAFASGRLSARERALLTGFAAFMIAAQLSSLPLWLAMAVTVLAGAALARTTPVGAKPVGAKPVGAKPIATMPVGTMPGGRSRGDPTRLGWLAGLLLPPALALMALCAVNLAGHGRLSPSPFGNVFLLARLLADGPAVAVLRDRCPVAGWRLCDGISRITRDSDEFLWEPDSPIHDAGGHKAVSAEAGAIIAATLREYPWAVARAALRNTLTQFGQMRSGDGLEPWPKQVSPWITRDFPPTEAAAYRAARQQAGALAVPAWLSALHITLAVGGMVTALALTVILRRRAPTHAAFLLLAVLVLPVCAAITGALSAPHDRYQARVALLPALVCAFTVFGLSRSRVNRRDPFVGEQRPERVAVSRPRA